MLYGTLRNLLDICTIWPIHAKDKWYVSQLVEERMKLKLPDDIEIVVY